MNERDIELERVLLELGAARERVDYLERRLREIRTATKAPESTPGPQAEREARLQSVPGRLRTAMAAVESVNGAVALDEIYKFVKKTERTISRAGVRARVLKLVDLGLVSQIDRGLFEKVKGQR